MNVAIMQPYLFPYLGYFQLIHAVDVFVLYDDVNYIKGGWINRNFLLAQGRAQRFTLPLEGASPYKLINCITVGNHRGKILETVRQSYGNAPQFAVVFPLIEEILDHPERNLARFLDFSLRKLCDRLELHPRWVISSNFEKNNSLRGQDKVIVVCNRLGASRYINSPGGSDLYDRSDFRREQIELAFIEPGHTSYLQFSDPFVPNLSIIDVMMFNNVERCRELLRDYTLV
jgi:hypothetical protein